MKCGQNEGKMDERGKVIIKLRKYRECNDAEMEEQVKLSRMRDKEFNKMQRQWDRNIEE